ncbi:hypothetical protein [Neolewinella sp.]
MYIGGRTPERREFMDLTAELSDWHMSVRKLLADLVPLPGRLAKWLFG